MTLIEVLAIIIIHFVADFMFQDEKWALGKSKKLSDLFAHTITYSVVWFIIGVAIFMKKDYLAIYEVVKFNNIVFFKVVAFTIITFLAHTITDYFTSRDVSKKFAEETPFHIRIVGNFFEVGDIIVCNDTQLIVIGKNSEEELKVKKYNSLPNFGAFAIIGIDQVLHYAQLFGTYYLLTR